MQIHVARGSSSLGVFSVEEVVSGLQSGKFLMTDLAWREGMSTWVMLAQWSEFAGVLPAAPPDVVTQSNNLSLTVPWEKSRSIGSYFETIKGAILTPYSTFASGVFSFKDYITFGYITALFLIPLSIFGQLYQSEVNQNLIEILESIPQLPLSDVIHGLRNKPSAPAYDAVGGVICYASFYPFFIALFGVFLWLGLRLFRESVTLSQTATAVLVSTSAINLFSSLILLTAPFKIYFLLGLLSIIPSIIITCRATAAVLKVSPFKVFSVWFLWLFVTCCCCCGGITLFGALLGFADR
jgi:hypothetical protein